MAHELEINADGSARMFFVGQKPWHGLGVELQNPPSIEDAIRLAGLDWTVSTHTLYANVGTNADGSICQVPTNAKAVIRSGDFKVLGVVGENYTPVQNAEAFAFFQPAVEAGFVTLETAGSLRGGSRVWVLARIKDTTHDIAAGDPINGYFLLSNSHDGTLAVRCGFIGIRVVCANTLNLAHHNDRSRLIQVRHTKNVSQGLEKLREIVDWQRGQFAATAEQLRRLVSYNVDAETLAAYVKEVFAPEIEARKPSENNVTSITSALTVTGRVRKSAEQSAADSYRKLTEKIVPLFEGVGAGGQGNNMKGVRGTMWAAYNSITGYLNHERGESSSTRLDSLWFGAAAKTNQRALEVALKMAA